ncbi:hypothetical protein Q3G72_026107 [Acer saccharum]|nr:hypothetical protein Q3G72_026107 [Acer saccharum]
MSSNQVAYSDNKKIKVSGEREQESSWSLGLRRWEDLSLDILKQIFNGVSISDLSRNVSSVCHSWQFCCWLFLCWESNELNLRITEAALGVVKETTAKPMNSIGVPCSSTEKYAQALLDIKLMDMLKSILEDNDYYGIYLANWRLSIQTVKIPENIQISDEHLIYIAERTTGLVKLELLGSSRITARGFAKALYNWKNIEGICFGKLRHDYFDQVIEEIGKNCSMLQIISLRMPDFHINRHNARVIIKNLRQVRALRFEGASLCSDGMEILFFSYTDIKVIQLWRCFLKDNEGNTDTANPIYSFPMSITFTFTEHAAWCRKYIEVPTGFDWDEWMAMNFFQVPCTLDFLDGLQF